MLRNPKHLLLILTRTNKQDYSAYESSNYPGHFIRHVNYRLRIDQDDGTDTFMKDASFFKESGEFKR